MKRKWSCFNAGYFCFPFHRRSHTFWGMTSNICTLLSLKCYSFKHLICIFLFYLYTHTIYIYIYYVRNNLLFIFVSCSFLKIFVFVFEFYGSNALPKNLLCCFLAHFSLFALMKALTVEVILGGIIYIHTKRNNVEGNFTFNTFYDYYLFQHCLMF